MSTQKADMMGAFDKEQLAWAVSQGRVVFTQDEDFLRLHAEGVPHKGMVFARQRTPIGDMVRGLMLICQVLDAEEMQDHVEFL